MDCGGLSWGIVPYVGDSAFKRARVYDEAQTQAVLRHLQAHECVALLGAAVEREERPAGDVAEALGATCCFRPLYVDLWQTRSQDEVTFFTSLAWQIGQALGREAEVPSEVPDARAFQNYLSACVAAGGAHLALMVDHLQALPHDLVHSLLVALRSAYMEWDADAPRQFVAVVTGGMNLVGLSTGPTSPFNIAKPVVVLPLTAAQSLALAQATLTAHGCIPSPAAAGAHRRVVRRRPLPAAPALRVERRRRPALPPPRADPRRGGSGRRADVRAPAGSAADPRGHPSDRRRPRHDARRAPPARSRHAAARPLPPDAHPHRHRPAPALGRSRVGGRSLQPAEPVLSASVGRALHHGAGRPHPAHRRPLGRGHRIPGAADGRIDEGRRTNDGGRRPPSHASFQLPASRPPTPPALNSWRPPSRRSMPSIRWRARPSCWPTGCGWALG